MRTIEGFALRSVLGEWIVVGEGIKQVNFDRLISLNDTAAMIWQAFEGKDFTNEEVAKWLTEKYDIDEETALADVIEITSKWIAYGIVSG